MLATAAASSRKILLSLHDVMASRNNAQAKLNTVVDVIGKGLNDYDRIFGTLAKAGYAGWVSIEDGEGPTVEIGLDNLRQSAKFLREKFAKHFGGGGDE